MPSLFDPTVRSALELRVRTLSENSRRQWGRMTPHQAVCHMADAFRMALGDKAVAARPLPFGPLVRFVALRAPVKWRRGIPTLPEVEQGCGGTLPVEFERDRDDLLALMARFASARAADLVPTHPIFGAMSRAQWGSWGYRHVDHHLRQFGV